MAFDEKEYKREWYQRNREKVIQRVKDRRNLLRSLKSPKAKKPPLSANERAKRFYHKNRSKILQQIKERRHKNNSYERGYYQKHKEEYQLWRDLHKEETRLWKLANRGRLREYEKLRRIDNIQYKLSCNLRKRVNFALLSQKAKKCSSTLELINCDIDQLKTHLESQFYLNKETGEMMTWENYGYWGWHIDHIKPCSSFDLTDLEQQKECFHWTNLQPLWRVHNMKKSSSLNYVKE